MLSRILSLFLICFVLPSDKNLPPIPPEEAQGEAFQSLACVCSNTLSSGYRCDALPAFQDNEWKHESADEFAARAADFVAKVETVLEDFTGEYYLALQGWADKRKITVGKNKHWSQVSRECRGKHELNDLISNRDLAFLRACELRRVIPEPLGRQIVLLPAIDFTDPSVRTNPSEDYAGNKYKAVVLFIVFPDRRICGNES